MSVVGCLCKFFNGGFTFEYAENLTIPELLELKEIAINLSEKEEKEIKDREKEMRF